MDTWAKEIKHSHTAVAVFNGINFYKIMHKINSEWLHFTKILSV